MVAKSNYSTCSKTGVADLLLDTGPIVALLNASDPDHRACASFFESFRGRFITTEAVLTEAVYLLGRIPGGSAACLEFFIRQTAHLIPQNAESLIRAKELMADYDDVPMDFADATLVALAEETDCRQIFTLDRREFATYRAHRRRSFRVYPLVG